MSEVRVNAEEVKPGPFEYKVRNTCEYSQSEHRLIKACSKHWADVITKTYISPLRLYEILAVEAFIKQETGDHIEALRKAVDALQGSKMYRMTPEFDAMITF